jgi:DNA-binding PadR family transcriptional regulator
MSPFEQAVLAVLAKAAAPYGWYNIEVRLSNMNLSERPQLPAVLAQLRDRGLVTETQHGEDPTLRYALTPAGRAAAGTA